MIRPAKQIRVDVTGFIHGPRPDVFSPAFSPRPGSSCERFELPRILRQKTREHGGPSEHEQHSVQPFRGDRDSCKHCGGSFTDTDHAFQGLVPVSGPTERVKGHRGFGFQPGAPVLPRPRSIPGMFEATSRELPHRGTDPVHISTLTALTTQALSRIAACSAPTRRPSQSCGISASA